MEIKRKAGLMNKVKKEPFVILWQTVKNCDSTQAAKNKEKTRLTNPRMGPGGSTSKNKH